MVEVQRSLRIEDNVVTLVDRVESHALAIVIVPGHHHFRCRKRRPRDQLVIPADRRTPVPDEMIGEPAREPALELIHVREPQPPHLGAHFRRRVPLLFVGLVATDGDMLRGEQPHHLIEHVVDELQGLLVGFQQPRTDPPVCPDGRTLAGDAKPWIGGHRRLRVSRESISGTTVTKRAAAYRTMSRTSAWV